MCFEIEKTICSDLCKIKGFLQDVLNKVTETIHDESLLFDIKIILHELVANSAIHGNAKDANKRIDVHVVVDQHFIKIEVTDQGKGFAYDRRAYDPMSMKCSGRGLVIVDGLSDEFYIERNKVVSVKYL